MRKKFALANLPHSAEIAREIGSLTHNTITMHRNLYLRIWDLENMLTLPVKPDRDVSVFPPSRKTNESSLIAKVAASRPGVGTHGSMLDLTIPYSYLVCFWTTRF